MSRYVLLFCLLMNIRHLSAQIVSADDLATVKRDEQRRIATIQNAMRTVVSIHGGIERSAVGSGVVISKQGHTITNYHVVAGIGAKGFASTFDRKSHQWKLIGIDPGGDLALIQLTDSNTYNSAPIGNSDHLQLGQQVLAMGNPFGLAQQNQPSVSMGVISGLHRYRSGQFRSLMIYSDAIQFDAAINPGNSGGPLFDMQGRVIGINGLAAFEDRGRVNVDVGFAIPMNQAVTFLPDLLLGSVVQHGTINVSFQDTNGQIAPHILNDTDTPLRSTDHLIEFNGHRIRSANDVIRLAWSRPAKWINALTVRRNGKLKTFRVRSTPVRYVAPKLRTRLDETPWSLHAQGQPPTADTITDLLKTWRTPLLDERDTFQVTESIEVNGRKQGDVSTRFTKANHQWRIAESTVPDAALRDPSALFVTLGPAYPRILAAALDKPTRVLGSDLADQAPAIGIAFPQLHPPVVGWYQVRIEHGSLSLRLSKVVLMNNDEAIPGKLAIIYRDEGRRLVVHGFEEHVRFEYVHHVPKESDTR